MVRTWASPVKQNRRFPSERKPRYPPPGFDLELATGRWPALCGQIGRLNGGWGVDLETTMDTVTTGRVTLFGHEPTTAQVSLVARTARWRMTRAFFAGGTGIALAPLVGLVPPHVPWALAAVGVGMFLARRRLREHYTLNSVEALCPRCGAELSLARPAALRTPHIMPCDACHYEPVLRVDPDPPTR